MTGPSLRSLLPSSSSFSPQELVNKNCATLVTTEKLELAPLSFLSRRQCPSSAISKIRHKLVKVHSVSQLGSERDTASDCASEASAVPSSSPSSPDLLSKCLSSSPDLTCERGIVFSTGYSFFRAQSSLGRDLAVLAAALYKRSQGQLRVLDAMSGCGVRAVRYLTQSQADFVLANDCNPDLHTTMVENLSRYAPLQGLHSPPTEHYFKLSTLKKSDMPENAGISENSGRTENPSTPPENPSRIENIRSTSEIQHIAIKVDGNGSLAFESSSSVQHPSRIHISSNDPEHFPNEARSFNASHSPALQCSAFAQRLSDAGVSCVQTESQGYAEAIGIKWQVSHEEATRLLMKCHLNKDFFDFIDVDSFGSDSLFIGAALSALRFGGLLFLTSTDGFTTGGHRPYK